MQEIAIACDGVTKSFKTSKNVTTALRGVTLEIRKSELFMLVGPSGCGKTTLISIIAGVLNNDAGSVTVLGKRVDTLSEAERVTFRGKTIGFVFQAFNLIPQLTAAENVSIPLLLNGAKRSVAMDKARSMLSAVGLEQKLNAKPTELSGGQQQRVAIARSLVHEPQLVVCDEPTSALDHKTGHDVMELLKQQTRERGCTLIIVTHDQRIYSFADRIGEMDDGQIQRVIEPTL